MEPVQPQQPMQPAPPQPAGDVGFPQQAPPPGSKPSGGNGKMMKFVIAIVGVVLIVAVGGFFIFSSGDSEGTSASPTPAVDSLSTFPTPQPTSTPSATATPEPEPVEKSEVSIEVLNGTGTPGDAGALQSELEDLGFTDITAGNADEQDATAAVATFSRDLPDSIVDEITAMLEELYAEVRTRKATLSGDFDVSIVTGEKASGTNDSSDEATDSSETDETSDSE